MDPKKLYFVIATATAMGYAAGEYDLSPVSEVKAGQNATETYAFKLASIPAPIMTMITNYLTSTVCPAVNGGLGDGVCDPDTVPFRIVLSRDRLLRDSVDGRVSDMPIFKTARPPSVPGEPEVP